MGIAVHYFKLHINDYAQATAHLSLLEDAAYTRLLRKYYADERPLPADLDRLQRLVGARSREEKNAVRVVLNEFFFLDGDFYRNKRADLEIEEFQSKSLKAKDSANARWMRTHSERSAEAVQTFSDGNANHKPLTINQEPKEKTRRVAPVVAKPDEVTDQTWTDFLAHRKLKRATVTDTVVEMIQREAQKAGWSLDAALRECVARGWQSFKAEWVQKGNSIQRLDKDALWDYAIGRKTVDAGNDDATIL